MGKFYYNLLKFWGIRYNLNTSALNNSSAVCSLINISAQYFFYSANILQQSKLFDHHRLGSRSSTTRPDWLFLEKVCKDLRAKLTEHTSSTRPSVIVPLRSSKGSEQNTNEKLRRTAQVDLVGCTGLSASFGAACESFSNPRFCKFPPWRGKRENTALGASTGVHGGVHDCQLRVIGKLA